MIAILASTPLPPFDFVERWSAPLEGGGSTNANEPSFAVAGGRIFYFTNVYKKPQVFGCLDLASGRSLWRTVGPVSTASYLAATSRHVVVATENDVLHLDPATGRILWRAHRESFRAGPVVSGDRMFYEDKAGSLMAIDLRTHRTIWDKRFPFTLTAGFASTSALGDGLLFSTGEGSVVSIAQKDGRLRWRTPVEKNVIFRFVPMGDSVLVVGNRYSSLRLRDGQPLWNAERGTSSSMVYLPGKGQIWAIPDDGQLYRFSADSGKSLGASPLGPEAERNFFSPRPYGESFLLPTHRSILKLDGRGVPVASFDTEDRLAEMETVNGDLVVRTNERFVRLTPGVPRRPSNVGALLWKPELSPAERRSVVRLGEAAVKPLLAAIEATQGDRRTALEEMLYSVAEAPDTSAVLATTKRIDAFEHEGFPGYLTEWLRTKGDPTSLADAMLPLFKAAKDDRARVTYLPYVLRGTSDAVVDDLLGRLRSPASPDWLKGAIYGSIALSGRADALSTIRKIRSMGRRLDRPIAGLSATADHDGDGLPDAVDANPFVAPRALDERERVLYAVFDARFRFDVRTDNIGQMRYGDGIRPFELVGWKGGLVPTESMKEAGLKEPKVPARSYSYPFVRFDPVTSDGAMVLFEKGGFEATADVGVTYGGLDGVGYRAKLRKVGGEWYVISLTQTWIS